MIIPIIIDQDEFEGRYKPIPGEDGDVTRSWEDVKDADERHVWTIVETEHGNLYADTGFHMVNKVGYLLTENPWEDEYVLGEWDIRYREPEGPIDTDSFVTMVRDLLAEARDGIIDAEDAVDRMTTILDIYDRSES